MAESGEMDQEDWRLRMSRKIAIEGKVSPGLVLQKNNQPSMSYITRNHTSTSAARDAPIMRLVRRWRTQIFIDDPLISIPA
jgi:hypothetical protein